MRLYLNHYLDYQKSSTSSTSFLEEPQEDANPDTWSAAYAKPDPNADKGGGDEPEVNYDYETNGNNGGTSIDPAQAECTKKTGKYLQSCVYISNNQRLDKNKKDGCKSNIASIGAACVFGPVKL
jgi:hypothetical protein